MAFLAASFTDDSMRLRATSIAFSGFTVGVTSKLTTLNNDLPSHTCNCFSNNTDTKVLLVVILMPYETCFIG